MITTYIKIYAILTTSIVILDLFWLGILAKDFYQKYLGFLMRPTPNWTPAIIFYLLYALAIIYFILLPNISKGSLTAVLISGAILGLVVYGTYELTNMAIIKDWPIKIVIVDIIWGIFMTSVVSAIGYWFLK